MHLLQCPGLGGERSQGDLWRDPHARPFAGNDSEHCCSRQWPGRARSQRRTPMKNMTTKIFLALAVSSIALFLASCSIKVDDKDKKNEKVDIQTPFASLKVDTDATSADNGIPVYPGAHLRARDKDDKDSHAANLSIGGPGFGLKVVAAEYETDDSPEKVKTF